MLKEINRQLLPSKRLTQETNVQHFRNELSAAAIFPDFWLTQQIKEAFTRLKNRPKCIMNNILCFQGIYNFAKPSGRTPAQNFNNVDALTEMTCLPYDFFYNEQFLKENVMRIEIATLKLSVVLIKMKS